MKKVTSKAITDAYLEWSKGDHTERLGQFLMNRLVPTETDADIFYEEDHIEAMAKFNDKYWEGAQTK